MGKKTSIIIVAIIAVLLVACVAIELSLDSLDKPCQHEYSEWTETKTATCTESGEEMRTCSKCGEFETQTVQMLGHEYSDAWTYDENGHWHVCTRTDCNAKSNEDAHIEQNHSCSVCGYITSEHVYGKVVYTWS